MIRSLSRLAAVAMVLPLVACGRDKSSADVIATLAPDTSAARIAAYESQGGLSHAGAAFLALSRVDYLKSEKNAYRFVAAFPTGMTTDVTIKVTPNKPYAASPEEAAAGSRGGPHDATLTHSVAGKTLTLRFDYVLPGGAVPAAYRGRPQRAVPRLASRRGTASAPVRWTMYPVATTGPQDTRATLPQYSPPSGAQSTGGVGVTIEAIFTQAGKEGIGKIDEAMWESMGIEEFKGKKVGGIAAGTACAALDIVEAFNTRFEYKELMKELDELLEAAENPTNNLTKDAYAKDPGLKDRIIYDIANVRSEVMQAFAVQYTNSVVGGAAGLIKVVGPLVSIAIAPLTSYTSNALKEFVQERMRAIRNQVTTGFVSNRQPAPPTPASGMQTGKVDCSPEVNTERPLTGTWTAMYQGTHEEFDGEGKLLKSITEKGTISFTVNGDQVSGDGTGQASYDLTAYEGKTSGTATYKFDVGGYVKDGKLLLGVSQGPTPHLFDAVFTTREVLGRRTPPPENVTMQVPSDMLLAVTNLVMSGGPNGEPRADAVKLQPGAAGRWVVDSVSKSTGKRTKETRTFTIQ